MDVNASSLNMDNWESSDSFSVIVSEDDVLGAITVPDSDTHSRETLDFTDTHDISIGLPKDSEDLQEHVDVAPSSQCFTVNEQPVTEPRPTSELDIVQTQHEQAVDSVSGGILMHHGNEHLVSDSDPMSGMDITHQGNKELVAQSDPVSGINTHQENEQLIADSVLEMDIIHHQNEQLIVDSDTLSGMGIVHPQNEQLVGDSDIETGAEEQHVGNESVSTITNAHNDNPHLIADSEPGPGLGITQEHSEQLDADSEGVSELGIAKQQSSEELVPESDPVSGINNESNEHFDASTTCTTETEINITQCNAFSASTNIQDNSHDNLTTEPETSLAEVDDGSNIGDGIDILAEASLGLLSENIFNKESVNQIKDIVASTIANFAPASSNINTEVSSAPNEHAYMSVNIPSHRVNAANSLCESGIEKHTSRNEVVTLTAEVDKNVTNDNSDSHTMAQSCHKTCDGNTMENDPISNKLVIPVTLAEVDHMFGDSHVVDSLLEESHTGNENTNRPTVENLESIGPPSELEESGFPVEEFKVVCGENIEIVESVEICMESSSAEVSFESPNSTLQQVQQHSQVYYENVKNSIKEQGTHNDTITFNAVESNLMSDSRTDGTCTIEHPQVVDLTPIESLSASVSNPLDSVETANISVVTEVSEVLSVPTETNESNQLLSETEHVSDQPQQPGPMKVAISTSGTSKKVIVLLPPRVVGRSSDKQRDESARPMQKMIPGVKIPSRSLSSQIVSADEIAKELYAQGLKKTPVRDLPQGGDLFYSRHLTKRLANRIVPSIASTSTVENISQPIKQQSEVQNIVKAQSVLQSIPIKSQPEFQNLLPDMMQDSGSRSISDSHDLLAILEGDVDEWSIDRPPPQLIEAVNSPITSRSSPPKLDPPIGSKMEMSGERKLDPVLERQLALQQLNSLDLQARNKKDNPAKARRKSKIQVKEDFDEVIVEEDGVLIGQPIVLVEDVKKKLTSSAKRSGKPLKRTAPSDNSSKTKNEAKTSKDKGAGESNKAGGVPEKKRKIVHLSEDSPQKKTVKSPDLVNGKSSSKSENTSNSNKEKEKKFASNTGKKHKQVDEKNADMEKKMKPPDSSSDKHKAKKRKISDETSGNVDEFVGPISRNMPPPPRTYSSRIKRSPMFPDFIVDHLPSTSKNKAVSVVASAKGMTASAESYSHKKQRKPLAKSPRVSTSSKVVPSHKRNTPTKSEQTNLPKKGRESDADKDVKKEKGKKRPSEIDRLLMDEGAINMLYSVKKDEENRRSGGTPTGASSKQKILKSARRSHKDLIMKTRLVKNAVLCLSNSPDSSQTNLRTKRTSGPPLLKKPLGVAEHKESKDSDRSPPPLTPFGISSPAQVFTYPSRIHLPAEASRIIRRHSSSSNFSSRSTSPNPSRRLSVEAASPQAVTTENVQAVDSTDSNFKQTRKKGVPIFIKRDDATQTYKAKKKKYSHHSFTTTESIVKVQESQESKDTVKISPVTRKPIPVSKTKPKAQLAKPFQKVVKGKVVMPAASKGKRTSSIDKVRSKDDNTSGPDLTTCLAEAATAFNSDDQSSTSPNSLSQSRSLDSKKVAPLCSNDTSYNNLIKTLETDSQKRQDGEDSGKERSSVRQSVGSFHYKELSLRRYDSMVQVILTSSCTKVKNALSLQVLRELQDVLNQLRKDDMCRAVLVTSTGSSFCQGLDFQSLINDKPDRRKAAAQELAHAVTKFMTSLAHFNKLIIAGVHGDAVGLGVTMLPFFDMVFASDKATFYTPYARLGQIPEGAAVVTLPLMLGNAVTSELLFGCRKLTASEALHYGLVTRILWPDRFQEELLPIIRSLANQSAQSMEATKALLRHSLRSKLDSALEAESHLLVQHWTSSECQTNFKRYLDDEEVGPQRQ